jgi:hypothetical protein
MPSTLHDDRITLLPKATRPSASGGPEAFRLPITRDLALSRDKRKNPQKEYSGSPEGAIFEFSEKPLALPI